MRDALEYTWGYSSKQRSLPAIAPRVNFHKPNAQCTRQ